MTMRTTHTYALLEVSAAAYDEVEAKLRDAGYEHAFYEDSIQMQGIALKRALPEVARREDGAYTVGPPPGDKTVEERCDELIAESKPAPVIEPEDHINLAQKFLHARRTLIWQRSFIDNVLLQLEVMKPDDALVALAVTRAELDMLCLGLQKLEAQYPKVTALRERLDILFKASL